MTPESTLGWDVLAWCSNYIRQPDGPDAGSEWRFTREQVLFVLRWYEVDERGRFPRTRGVLRRAKGWGKSPFVAALALAELCGPTRCDGFDADGKPVAVPVAMPWVQLAGVSEKQTVNTMSMVLAMIAESAVIDDYGVDPGLTRIFTRSGGRLEPITASAPTAEGARPTFVVEDETHLWIAANGGHKLDQVNRRNLGKSRDGAARMLETTNAHEPGQDSVAERSYAAWQAQHKALLYDSLEAPEVASLEDDEALIPALKVAYGDSTWVDLERIREEIRDPATPEDVSRRFYLNQATAPANSLGNSDLDFDLWLRLAEHPTPLTNPAFGTDVDESGTGWIAVAWHRPDERIQVQLVSKAKDDDTVHIPPMRLSERATELRDTYDSPVMVGGTSASMVDGTPVTSAEFAAACRMFAELLDGKRITHCDQPDLNRAVQIARWRSAGSQGERAWLLKGMPGIGPLAAVTRALHGLVNAEQAAPFLIVT